MAITTYSELKSAIVNWYKDRSDLADFADEFIDLAEAYFNLEIRTREMETVEDLTPTNNVCTLPTDYLEYKRVVELTSIRRPLEYITEDAADSLYPTRAAGLSGNFMIIGNELTALPLSTNDIELTYYQQIPALSDSNTTNWLLTRMPNLYLHACLMYAAEFTKDPGFNGELQKHAALVDKYRELLTGLDNRAKFANAGVTMTGDVW